MLARIIGAVHAQPRRRGVIARLGSPRDRVDALRCARGDREIDLGEIVREPGAQPLRLNVRDVEVSETEARTQAAVALLVDTSFSMAMDGRWVPMKRTALALHTLIRSRFRGDALQLIGFGRHAQVIDIEELTGLDAMWDKGTNLHHALLLANRFFRKHPSAQPVLLVVTDGEPTSHLEPNGEGTAIRWVSEFDPKYPGTGWLLRRALDGFIAGLTSGLAEHAGAGLSARSAPG